MSALLVCGCNPDEFSMTVPVSEVVKAASGDVGYANVRVLYKISHDSSAKSKVDQIRDIVKEHLGEDAVVNLDSSPGENIRLTASWKAPVVSKDNLSKVDRTSVLWLLVDGETVEFSTMRGIKALNAELHELDSNYDATFQCDMDITVINNTNSDWLVRSYGTFVNKEPRIISNYRITAGNHVVIVYKRHSDSSVYHTLNPKFEIIKYK